MEIASSVLLLIGNLNAGNQPGGDAPAKSTALPQFGNLKSGNQPATNKKMFVNLPEEWKMDDEAEMETNSEGNCLQKVVRIFYCRSCMPKSMKSYMESFFDYLDKQMREMKDED